MNSLFPSDNTIIACSTGENVKSAISILRISGFESLETFQKAFTVNLSKTIPRKAVFTKLVRGKEVLDEVLLYFFKGPNSYNGENILEVHLHGNPVNVDRVVRYFVDEFNIEYAKPGEFTFRALRNKKMNLSQVEGLDVLLNSSSTFGISQGLSLLHGSLNEKYAELYTNAINCRSSLELLIDFSEDVGEQEAFDSLKRNLTSLGQLLSELEKRTQSTQGDLLRPSIGLIGVPNSGKSTLFNYLVGFERSIVSDIKGTTRDFVSESVKFGDSSYRLVDTAGVRESDDKIEAIGVERSLEIYKNSFFKILLINAKNLKDDLSDQLNFEEIDLAVVTHCDEIDPKILNEEKETICSKWGINVLLSGFRSGSIEPFGPIIVKSGPIEPAKNLESGPIEPAKISESGPIEPVKNLESGPIEPVQNPKSGPIGPVENEIFNIISDLVTKKHTEISSGNPILLERHKFCISKAQKAVSELLVLMNSSQDLGIIDTHLNDAIGNISDLIGVVNADDVLNHIFSNFCIGK